MEESTRPALLSPLWRPLLVMATLAIALGGCTLTNSADGPDPTPAPPQASETALSSEAVSGVGPTEQFPGVAFPIPEDARSVVVDFDCSGGGGFSVELGDAMVLGQATLTGTCDGTHQLAWPVTD